MFDDDDFPSDGSKPPDFDSWEPDKQRAWHQEARRRRSRAAAEASAEQQEAQNHGNATPTAAPRGPDHYESSEMEGQGHVTQDASGDEQWFSIDVTQNPARRSYLRLGRRPDPSNVAAPLGEKYGDNQLGIWGGGLTEDDGAMQKGFIHDGSIADVDGLKWGSSWVDHAEGHRVSTTAGSKVEVVQGNYKLITCGGKAGIDFSAGHMQAWAVTPGYISQVDIGGSKATETLIAPSRYDFRFVGDVLTEHTSCNEYESLMGHSTVQPGYGAPGAAQPSGDGPLVSYTDKIASDDVITEVETFKTHTDTVKAAKLMSLLGASDGVLERTVVGAKDPGDGGYEAGAYVGIVSNGGCEDKQVVRANDIEEETKVGAVTVKGTQSATERMDETTAGTAIARGTVSVSKLVDHAEFTPATTVTTTIDASGVLNDTFALDTHDRVMGANYRDTSLTAFRESVAMSTNAMDSIVTLNLLNNVTAVVMLDMLNCGFYLEQQSGIKVELTSMRVDTSSGPATKMAALSIFL